MTSLGIAIVGWEAISPLGIGAKAFGPDAMPPAALANHPLHESEQDFPTDIAYRPAYFDVASLIGAKGIRTMDRTTALAVCTAKLLHGDRPVDTGDESEHTGFVLGTSTGSIRSTSDFTRESLIQERPFLVNPALFPNTVMNCAAGQCGIWFKARSVNATISGGRLSGLLAIKYAAQMLRRGYARRLFTGSVEELCPQSAWAHRALVRHGRRHAVPIGEGAAMFELQRMDEVRAGGHAPAAEVLALRYGRYFDPLSTQDPVQGVIECMGEALHQCQLTAADVVACSLCTAADAAGSEIERQAVERLLRRDAVVHGADFIACVGDTYSASFSLGLGRLLAGMREGVGMALAVGEDGHVGCLIVRT